jgi:DNA recombination protein RmuC
MDLLPILVALAVGFCLGLLAAFVLRIIHGRTASELTEQLFFESENRRKLQVDAILADLKASFGSLSLEALSRSTAELLKLAQERFDGQRAASSQELEAKKGLIDQQLERMKAELEGVSKLVKELEKDREAKFGSLVQQLSASGEQTAALIRSTSQLREALSSTRARGQWGERMAEDVLRLAGFQEGVNYRKQLTVQGTGRRPDFTFLLPKDLKIHMDVKFPLDNYLGWLNAGNDAEKETFKSQFLRDVRKQVKEVTTRDYINPEDHTVDCVLLFIPNESIYAFIYEQDSSVVDDAIKSHVVMCSPLSLFAVLAVIREAVDSFALERTSNEILALLGSFKKQWAEFLKRLELMGKRIEDARKEYEALTTTRRRQLEKPLERLDALRSELGIEPAEMEIEMEYEGEE